MEVGFTKIFLGSIFVFHATSYATTFALVYRLTSFVEGTNTCSINDVATINSLRAQSVVTNRNESETDQGMTLNKGRFATTQE